MYIKNQYYQITGDFNIIAVFDHSFIDYCENAGMRGSNQVESLFELTDNDGITKFMVISQDEKFLDIRGLFMGLKNVVEPNINQAFLRQLEAFDQLNDYHHIIVEISPVILGEDGVELLYLMVSAVQFEDETCYEKVAISREQPFIIH